MKLTTSQWRGVSSAIPLSRAIAAAICSSQSSVCVRNPSASTSTGLSAISAVVISSSCSGRVAEPLPGARHRRPEAGNLAAGEQRVPVDRLEEQLAEVVEVRLAEQRQWADDGREAARQRFGVVVEVDQECLVKA